jgi:hypothetical protein
MLSSHSLTVWEHTAKKSPKAFELAVPLVVSTSN